MSGHDLKHACAAAALLAAFGAVPAEAAGPKIVSGPSADAGCFVPWTDKTKFFQYAKKPGPYRVALANGFIGNTWRIQMIKTAKAYAEQPEVKKQLKEFKVVSTGDDIAAQISAVNNFIDSGYDAVIIDAQNPTAFRSAVKRAEAAGVVLVAFDNTLDTDEAINVNVDQEGLGQYWGEWLAKSLPKGGDVLEVRGVPGTSVDTDRHRGLQDALKASGKPFSTVEVVGRWDDGTAQKVSADAIAVHKHFDGMTAQGGSTGMVRAFLDAGAPLVPAGAETENGFRKLCLDDRGEGPRLRVRRHRPGPGGGGDEDGAGGAFRRNRAAVDPPAAGPCRGPGLQGGGERVPRPDRQLLRRQFLPDLRHRLHRPGDHGPLRDEPVGRIFPRPRGERSRVRG